MNFAVYKILFADIFISLILLALILESSQVKTVL